MECAFIGAKMGIPYEKPYFPSNKPEVSYLLPLQDLPRRGTSSLFGRKSLVLLP